jgi:hypothetical protein
MGFREDILRKIERKQADLLTHERAFERERAATEAYIQALQDMLKVLPRDASEARPDAMLRTGSVAGRAREAILAANRPLHINPILKELGRGDDRKSRASLTGALGAYARKGEVFVRTAPNTFGLLELGHAAAAGPVAEELPRDFGSLSEGEGKLRR